jgi:hypothetical protein
MTNAIWMISYDLDPTREEEYLQWFDTIHIPEKLARDGYTWAAHYQVVDGQNQPTSRYIALFGGTDSRVFYDPSPAQIKPTQTAETRDMMSCRSASQMLILAAEWAMGDNGERNAIEPQINADFITLIMCNCTGNDEDFGAWLVQEQAQRDVIDKPAVQRKYLASTGVAKHVFVQEYYAEHLPRGETIDPAIGDWAARVSEYLSYPLGKPVTARRVWP